MQYLDTNSLTHSKTHTHAKDETLEYPASIDGDLLTSPDDVGG